MHGEVTLIRDDTGEKRFISTRHLSELEKGNNMSIMRSVSLTHPQALDMSATIGTSTRNNKTYVRIAHRLSPDSWAELDVDAWREFAAEIEAVAERVQKAAEKAAMA